MHDQQPAALNHWPELTDRLREARSSRALSLRALAGRIGVSPSLISQIETGKVKPSVNTLYALATELDLSIDELLFRSADSGEASDSLGSDGPPAACVQRASSRATVQLAPGVLWERLTGVSQRGVDFLHLVYEPGSESIPAGTPHRHAGREWGFVMCGRLQVEVDSECYLLGPGDSITFESSRQHRLHNPGDEEVRAIWFVLGRRPDQTPTAERAQVRSGASPRPR